MAMQKITNRLVSWASVLEESTLEQARRTSTMPFIHPHLALMPDAHLGKGDGDAATLRSTWMIVQLDNGMMPPPRFFWGLRLWVYAPFGRCWSFDIAWRSRRRYAESDANRARLGDLFVAQRKAAGEWPPSYAEGPDYLGAMLGAQGLGLKITERPEE